MEKIENIQETVIELLKEYMTDEVDPNSITLESSVRDDLGLDSLAVVEMVLDVEMKFDVEVDDDDAQSLQTVGDIVKYVEQLQEG